MLSFVFYQLMGASISEQYGGSAATFFSTVLLIEEIAKVDMSVSVMVDVQNTLVAPVLEQHGTEQQKQKYLTQLCSDVVRLNTISACHKSHVIVLCSVL